jgi:hypothetical protein
MINNQANESNDNGIDTQMQMEMSSMSLHEALWYTRGSMTNSAPYANNESGRRFGHRASRSTVERQSRLTDILDQALAVVDECNVLVGQTTIESPGAEHQSNLQSNSMSLQ